MIPPDCQDGCHQEDHPDRDDGTTYADREFSEPARTKYVAPRGTESIHGHHGNGPVKNLAKLPWPEIVAYGGSMPTTTHDVLTAWRAIAQARTRYAQVLRAALADGVPQGELAATLGRSREMLRRDAKQDALEEEK
jgi:hypothetical protein